MLPPVIDENSHGWFVCREAEPHEDDDMYLHSDGVWRWSTVADDGRMSGFFDTREAAEAALKKSQ
jgi:hypothetical protein